MWLGGGRRGSCGIVSRKEPLTKGGSVDEAFADRRDGVKSCRNSKVRDLTGEQEGQKDR